MYSDPLKPCPPSMTRYYIDSLFPLIAMLMSTLLADKLRGAVVEQMSYWLRSLPQLSQLSLWEVKLIGLTWALLLSYATLRWLMGVEIRHLICYSSLILIAEILIALKYLPNTLISRSLIYTVASLLGLAITELMRRSYIYELKAGYVSLKSGIMRKRERIIPYAKISDVVVERGPLARIFGYGSIVLLTASGLGVANEGALAMVIKGLRELGLSVGGFKSVRRVRYEPSNCLYGVRSPEKIKEFILNMITGSTNRAVEGRLLNVEGASPSESLKASNEPEEDFLREIRASMSSDRLEEQIFAKEKERDI